MPIRREQAPASRHGARERSRRPCSIAAVGAPRAPPAYRTQAGSSSGTVRSKNSGSRTTLRNGGEPRSSTRYREQEILDQIRHRTGLLDGRGVAGARDDLKPRARDGGGQAPRLFRADRHILIPDDDQRWQPDGMELVRNRPSREDAGDHTWRCRANRLLDAGTLSRILLATRRVTSEGPSIEQPHSRSGESLGPQPRAENPTHEQ